MADGKIKQILPHRGRWQREALTEGGVAMKAAKAAARCCAQCLFAPLHHLRWFPSPKGGESVFA